jgi:NADH-quinone oxidoreductase subunit L
MFMTFFGVSRASNETLSHVHESPPVMLVPLVVLSFGALFAGAAFAGLFVGSEQTAFWAGSIFTAADNQILIELKQVPSWVVLSPLVMMISGFALAWVMYIYRPSWPSEIAAQHDLIYKFLLNKWYFDELYDFIFVRPAKWLARFFWKGGDGFVIDGFGPDGIAANVLRVTRRMVGLQSGYVYHYAFVMLLGVAGIVSWLMLTGGLS